MTEGARWTEIADGVFAGRYPFLDQQIGLVIGDSEALVVDTRSTAGHAREILDDIRRITAAPVRVVVDTHWHWDHAFGNATFRPATIWGHVRTHDRLASEGRERRDEVAAELAGEMDPELRAAAPDIAAVVIDPPDHVLESHASLEVGGRSVILRHLGLGHTDADVVVLVPDADVLFAGDLLEEGATPSFGDAWPIDWPDTVERLLTLATGVVVPGHGALGDTAFVRDQLAALQANASLASEVHAGSASMEEAISRSPWAPATAREPLERALAQLRGELG